MTHPRSGRSRLSRGSALLTLIVSAACLACADREPAVDTAAPDTTIPMVEPPGDSAALARAARPPARDADHEFLRDLSDHHQTVIELASASMTAASRPETQTDAHDLHVRHEAEQKELLAVLAGEYDESFEPAPTAQHEALLEHLQLQTGLEYDRTFYRDVIAHQREGIALIDRHLPRLTRPALRQLAERVRGALEGDVAEFEEKLNEIGPAAAS